MINHRSFCANPHRRYPPPAERPTAWHYVAVVCLGLAFAGMMFFAI